MQLTLPILPAPGRPSPDAAPVLIVDDLPEKHTVFRSILDELGEPIVSVRCGRDALAQLLDHDFAVILLDVHMPGIDGLETAQLIREHPRLAGTPIVFISSHLDDVQVRRGYALGAVDCIPAPVAPMVLRAKVQMFMQLHRLTRQLRRHAEEREALARAEAARDAAQEAGARADFLCRASEALSRSLDPAEARQALVRMVVPALARRALLLDSPQAPAAAGLAGPVREALARALDPCAPAEWLDPAAAAWVLPLRSGERQGGALVLLGLVDARDGARLALGRELAQRAAIALDNARLHSALREADRRKNEFLAMLAHELRNPLAPIRNAVHIMQAAELPPARVAWARDVIRRQADHMTRIIDDLLDVSRIVQGKVTVRFEPLWLSDLVERCVEATAPRLQARDQALRLALPPHPVRLHADPVRLAQVLTNLVNNASKFSPPGASIDLRAGVEEGRLRLAVRDAGCGIDPAFLPHIFELFVQGEQPLDRSQGGLGIGLTLVRHLVELHGGQVQASSEGIGRGCEVALALPLPPQGHEGLPGAATQPQAPPAGRAMHPPGRPGAATRRVLVVDDLAPSAQTLTLLLEMEGYEVRVAGEGGQALALAEAFEPQVVLLDIGLPGLNGFEVAARLRQLPATRNALLVALTGYGEAASRERAAQAGFDVHMVKPADVDRLLALLAQPLQVRAAGAAESTESAATIEDFRRGG